MALVDIVTVADIDTDFAQVNNFKVTMISQWSQEHIVSANSITDFQDIIRNCFSQDSNINLIQAELVIIELIKRQHNPYDTIITELNLQINQVHNSFQQITSPHFSSNFIISYNRYFSGVKKIRQLMKYFNQYFIFIDTKDIMYTLGSYVFYKNIFDKEETSYQKLINNLKNFNGKEVIDIMRILYHYISFVKYFKPTEELNFTHQNPQLDFSKSKLDYVIEVIIDSITKNIIELNTCDDITKKTELTKDIINNIRIYTSLPAINNLFCEAYINKLNIRENTNLDIEKILVSAFDISTDIKYINTINTIINLKNYSNDFNEFMHNYDRSQINITQDKFLHMTVPNPTNIIVDINQQTTLPILFPTPVELELYLKLVSSLFNNFSNNSKNLNYDYELSSLVMTINLDKEYEIVCNLLQFIILDYINNQECPTLEKINSYIGQDCKIY